MISPEVWYAIPTASERNCAETLPEWRARGYRIALLQDKSNRFDADADITVAPFDDYRGYGRSINHLIREVIPASAPIVVAGGDDMFPDMAHTAEEIAAQFLQRFPDTFGVMQPIGDAWENTANICGSPWIGREFARRMYGGRGAYCEEYFQLYEDTELHDVAEALGLLWKRPDLMHFHKQWKRERGSAAVPPAYLEKSLARERESAAIYARRKAAGFPGHEPGDSNALMAVAGAPVLASAAGPGGVAESPGLSATPARPGQPSQAMPLIALMPARNEAWIIGLSLSVALMWCDEAIVYDHASTDATRDIVAEAAREHPGRVRILDGDEPAWNEMRIRRRLMDAAREHGRVRAALVDADEIITANLLPVARDLFARGCVPGFAMRLPMVSPWGGVERVRTDGAFGGFLYAGFEASPGLEYVPAGDGYEMHGRVPAGLVDLDFPLPPGGGVMHMQFASASRLRAKAVWYKMTEALRFARRATPGDLNKQYDWALHEPGATAPMPEAWWGPYRTLAARYLDLKAEPWHAAEVRAMLARHGRERFAGIEMHGVAA